MYGFLGIIGDGADVIENRDYTVTKNIRFIHNESVSKGVHIWQKTVNKFINDKVFYTSKSLIVTLEGVVYNFRDLCESYGVEKNDECIIAMYKRCGPSFINELNGNFCMFILDFEKRKLYLFSNHTGYRPLYYYHCVNDILFSSDLNWLYNSIYYAQGRDLELDIDATISILTHGYMIGSQTLVKNVKKILPGEYLEYNLDSHQSSNVKYFDYNALKFSNDSYEHLLEKADMLFRKAVKRIYEKDNEYGYKHFCTLSGGLDSRSVAYVADSLGYTQDFFTIGESGCLDEQISSLIAKELRGKHITLQLDNGNYLLNADIAVRGNGGTITFPGFLHLYDLFASVNLENYGAIITGEIGDAVFGGSKNEYHGVEVNLSDGAFFHEFDFSGCYSHDFSVEMKNTYKDAYSFIFYNRILNSACNGWFASYYFTESASPFIDKDFLNFILAVPPQYKTNSKFYIDWLKKYYPKACHYLWTSTRTKPDASDFAKLVTKVFVYVRTKLLKHNLSMNPYDTWIKNNPALKDMIDESINYLLKSEIMDTRLNELILKLSKTDNFNTKFMLVTLQRALEIFHISIKGDN